MNEQKLNKKENTINTNKTKVAGEWRYRELKIVEKTDTDPDIYQFILDKNGVAILFSDEFTRTDSSWAIIQRELLADIVERLNGTK